MYGRCDMFSERGNRCQSGRWMEGQSNPSLRQSVRGRGLLDSFYSVLPCDWAVYREQWCGWREIDGGGKRDHLIRRFCTSFYYFQAKSSLSGGRLLAISPNFSTCTESFHPSLHHGLMDVHQSDCVAPPLHLLLKDIRPACAGRGVVVHTTVIAQRLCDESQLSL